MIKILKRLYRRSSLIYMLLHPIKISYNFLYYRIMPNKIIIKRNYKKVFGTKINLDNPVTLNEKINWLKLHDRSDLHTLCADKFAVREHIKNKIGKEFLVPLILQTEDVKDITEDNIPDYPVIIKTNHDSSGGIIIRNKENIDFFYVRKKLNKLMKRNYYTYSLEWQYKNIKPCVIVEKLLIDKNGGIPFDYKVHCFNGKAITVQVDLNRGTENHARNWYDLNWKREPFWWSSVKKCGTVTDPSDKDVKKPENFELMLKLSEKLAGDFIYVRVDWYEVNGFLYFGELTFHHDSGMRPIYPRKWDKILGEKLRLS
ncbi:MAG: glycosyl transferase [Candidatus Cloacimonadota bacterium]|nr:MAG: glycosyl transferase [Candidatus Cloacimonadota bacterium]